MIKLKYLPKPCKACGIQPKLHTLPLVNDQHTYECVTCNIKTQSDSSLIALTFFWNLSNGNSIGIIERTLEDAGAND